MCLLRSGRVEKLRTCASAKKYTWASFKVAPGNHSPQRHRATPTLKCCRKACPMDCWRRSLSWSARYSNRISPGPMFHDTKHPTFAAERYLQPEPAMENAQLAR